MKSVIGDNGAPARRRWGRGAIAAVAGVGIALTGCARTPPALDPTVSAVPMPSDATPSTSPSETPSASSTASASGTPSASATSTAPSTTGVKATGSLTLYSDASSKLTGTCRTVAGAPRITVADRSNEFFGTIDATLVLAARRTTVSRLTIALGEDSELITRTLDYTAAQPAQGTSVALTGKGSTFTVSGKLTNTENGRVAGTIPVKLTVTCAGSKW